MGFFDSDTAETTTYTDQKTNEWALPAYQDLFSRATRQSKSGGGFFDKKYGGGMDITADMTPEQLAAIQGMTQSGQATQGLIDTSGMTALQSALGEFDPNNPGLTGALDANLMNFQRNVLPNISDAAMKSGVVGSTRHGVAEGLAMTDLNRLNAQTIGQAYNAHEANRLNALSNLPQLARSMGAGSEQVLNAQGRLQEQEQRGIDDKLQAWAYENGIDLKNLQGLQSILSSVTPQTVTGTSTSTQPTQGFGQQLLEFGVEMLPAILSTMSDRRLKTNIQEAKLGVSLKLPDGVKFYTWDWKPEAEALGYTGQGKGVIAQEIELKYPDVVIQNFQDSGYKAVNYPLLYSKLSDELRGVNA